MSGRRRLPLAWIVTLPFFAYTFLFLFLPAGNVMTGAFESKTGGWTFANIRLLFHHPYIDAYKTSIEVSAVTAGIGALAGLAIAYAAIRDGTPRWVRNALTTFSGVAANFGGIPLAFAFIATIGNIGIVTKILNDHFGFNLLAWTPPLAHEPFAVFSFIGVSITYLYFQIPLMLLVISPAIDGLKKEWREAS